jgi:hypothetical protein
MNKLRLIVRLTTLWLVAGPGAAHHSAAAFDPQAQFTATATVVQWRWTNPHCLLTFVVKGEGQKAEQQWIAETSNPTDMARRGWIREQLKPGDVITLTIQPARNGAPVGRIMSVVLADGKSLRAYGRQEGSPAPTPER